MKFVIEHLKKRYEKKEVLQDKILPLKPAKSTGFWAETAQAKQRCLIA